MRKDLVVVYRGRDHRWYWRYVAQNGELMADGGQGYSRRIDALNGAKRVTGHRLRRKVKFVTGPSQDPL